MDPAFGSWWNGSTAIPFAGIQAMQTYQKKQETEIQLLKEKTKELEFMNALLSDRLALAQRKQFGSSSEKYAEGYEQMDLFNEAEQEADPKAVHS